MLEYWNYWLTANWNIGIMEHWNTRTIDWNVAELGANEMLE
jgi:hypothetical protein